MTTGEQIKSGWPSRYTLIQPDNWWINAYATKPYHGTQT